MSYVKRGERFFCFLLTTSSLFFLSYRFRVLKRLLGGNNGLAIAHPAIRARPRRDGTS